MEGILVKLLYILTAGGFPAPGVGAGDSGSFFQIPLDEEPKFGLDSEQLSKYSNGQNETDVLQMASLIMPGNDNITGTIGQTDPEEHFSDFDDLTASDSDHHDQVQVERRQERDLTEIGWHVGRFFTRLPPVVVILLPLSMFSVLLALDYLYIAGVDDYRKIEYCIVPLSVILWMLTIISVVGFFFPIGSMLSKAMHELSVVATVYSVGFLLWQCFQYGLFNTVATLWNGVWVYARGFFY